MNKRLYLSKINMTGVMFEIKKGGNAVKTEEKTNRLQKYADCTFEHFAFKLKSIWRGVLGSYKVPYIR